MATIIQTDSYVIDVTEQTFEAEVIKRSETVPVIVDFWAEWCGPCRTLGPTLEKLALEFNGAFILAKVDVDSNPNLARQFYVQGIPAVKAFYNGKVLSEFSGALPETQVRDFIKKVLPSQADLYAKQAYEWEMGNQLAMAVTNYEQALTEDKEHYHAMVGLGRTLLKQDKPEEALAILSRIPDGLPEKEVASALIATAQFQHHAASHSEADLKSKIEADPNDLESRYALASLYAGQQQFEEALAQFLEVVRRDRAYNDDGARKAMLALFTSIGQSHPLVQSYQQKLASVLF